MNANRIDTSTIDRMDTRQRIANSEDARAGIVAELDAAEAPFRARIAVIEDEMAAATKDARERLDQHDATAKADEDVVYAFDDDGRPSRCCISGLVLLDGDHLVEDLMFDNFALVGAVAGWPTAPQELPDVEDKAA